MKTSTIRLILVLAAIVLTLQATSAQQLLIVKSESTKKSTDSLLIQMTQNSITRKTHKLSVAIATANLVKLPVLSAPAFLQIRSGSNMIIGIIEPGEQLTFHADSFQINGKGTEKFKIATELQRFRTSLSKDKSAQLKQRIIAAKKTKLPFDALYQFADSAKNAFLAKLQSHQKQLSSTAYTLLKAEIIGSFMLLNYNIPTYIYNEDHQTTLSTRKSELSETAITNIKNRLNFDSNLAISDRYLENVYTILFKEYGSQQLESSSNNLKNKYAFITANLPEPLRLGVLALFFESDLSRLNQGEDLEQLIEENLRGKQNSHYSQFIRSRISELFKTGTPAPEFKLTDTNGKEIQLKDFKEKVLLIDFWFKDCAPCHALFNQLKTVKNHFENQEVVFLNVSIDTKAVWTAALKQFNIKGVHAYTQGLSGKHPMIAAYKVAAYPTMVLIDKQGKISNATPSSIPSELIAQINATLKK